MSVCNNRCLNITSIMACLNDYVIVFNESNYRIVYSNKNLGKTNPGQLLDTDFFSLFVPANRDSIVASFHNALITKLPQRVDTAKMFVDSKTVFVEIVLQSLEDGANQNVLAQIRDVSKERQIAEANYIKNEQLRLAIEGSGDAVWDWDINTNKGYLSSRWKQIIGYEDHEIGDSFDEWRSRVHPADLAETMARYDECLSGKTSSYSAEYRLKCKDGSWKWCIARAAIVYRNADQTPSRMTGLLSDVSEKKAWDERLWRAVNYDTLTNLPNRRLFVDRLNQAISQAHFDSQSRSASPSRSRILAVIYLDLDRFKDLNDMLGHNDGDILLTQVGQRICECVHQYDTVGRFGGDEFAVVVSDFGPTNNVELVIQKIILSLGHPFTIGDTYHHIDASIGVAMYPQDGTTSTDLIRNAEQSMYAAKGAGGKRHRYFNHAIQERAQDRHRLMRDMHNALEGGQFSLVYQPVVDLVDGTIVKAEALLRWLHPTLGLIDPGKFIPLAEESGLITKIGDWVFREAVSCASQWRDRTGRTVQIGVNKSPAQFQSEADREARLGFLTHLQMPRHSIAIEITEGLLLDQTPWIAEELGLYRKAGIQVSIDDFGTGYSSMAYLKKFCVDYLKIDQSFVRDLETNADSRTIVETIIVMAHKLGLKVIAEGIETNEQKIFLTSSGCDFGQGFLFSKGVTAEAFERLLINEIADS